jgi:hypothetical protein
MSTTSSTSPEPADHWDTMLAVLVARTARQHLEEAIGALDDVPAERSGRVEAVRRELRGSLARLSGS